MFGLEAVKPCRRVVPLLARLENQLEAETCRPHIKVAEPTREIVLAGGGAAVVRGLLLGEQVPTVRPEQLEVGRQTREGFASELR